VQVQRERDLEWSESMNVLKALCTSLLLTTCVAARGEVRLPKLISDHAVLQRERPIHLWGWATPGARLLVHFHEQEAAADADAVGRWSVYLKPELAGGPYVLRVTGDGDEVKVSDVLMGDVWFASGQSNMEMPLSGFPPSATVKDAEKEIAAAKNPKLRLLLVTHQSSDIPLTDITTTWTECTPETAKSFSAVAYFFGREIAAKEGVAIGLIDSSWGGTPADSWVSLDTLGTNAMLLPAFASRARFAEQEVDLDQQMMVERREDAEAKAAGKPTPGHPWHPDAISWMPAGLYNGMIAPFAPMTIKGFLWYQGETNSGVDRAPYYESLFGALIGDWRMHFAQGNLPFLYVQISSFSSPAEEWGLIREQQRRVLSVANTAMTVSLDVGLDGNVHPPDKQTVGKRLALTARALAYGEAVPDSGPEFREATTELTKENKVAMRVWFDHADGLTYENKGDGSFEVAGPDHKFFSAQATVQGDTVLVTSAAVAHPSYVRYGWTSVVHDYLRNSVGLPASTFSSEPSLVH
jgi:sialate O-acetylesterase